MMFDTDCPLGPKCPEPPMRLEKPTRINCVIEPVENGLRVIEIDSRTGAEVAEHVVEMATGCVGRADGK